MGERDDGTLINTYGDRLIEEELSFEPAGLGRFLREDSSGLAGDDSFGFFAYSYARAFEVLFEAAMKRPHHPMLMHPLLLLCRHSIELSLKEGLRQLATFNGGSERKITHNLETLWAQLRAALREAGLEADDDYTALCTEAVTLLHGHDLRGDRFRYPESTTGFAFASTLTDLDGLFKAHHRVTTYCGSIGDMLAEMSPPAY
ncbi:hypothetical protein [Sphingomonas sp. S2-65]|uniref:hypothetical protein n=1 Tax=Sphingomonas sp. S2-65 TaxID=2903960 RepID=UPI001F23B6A9|nr:hypothetical protein [Sphingomonas sp. S2-65]UYY59938.1 hypothetical protein LZ586_07595 [Sphingomonas sp. S2-65]